MKYEKGDIIMVDDRRAVNIIRVLDIILSDGIPCYRYKGSKDTREHIVSCQPLDNITKKIGHMDILPEGLFEL